MQQKKALASFLINGRFYIGMGHAHFLRKENFLQDQTAVSVSTRYFAKYEERK